MQQNLYEYLVGNRSPSVDATVAVEEAGRTPWTYRDLDAISSKIAGVLHDMGVTKGDRVVAQVGKSSEALALYLAVLRLGAIYLPLNTDYTSPEVARFVADAQPTLLVASEASLEVLMPVIKDDCKGAVALEANGSGELIDRCSSVEPRLDVVDVAPDDVAAILYTSGTTGRSKGAMLTHANLTFITQSLCEQWEITSADVLLHALPMFHAHGLFIALGPVLHKKAKVNLLPKFSVDAVLAALTNATVFMGVPTFYSRLLADPRFDREVCESLRLFTSGSAPLSTEMFKAFEERTGKPILERYGLTETTIVSSNPLRGERVPGTVGYALPGVTVRVAPSPESIDGEGELEVKGPNVFKGYWKMPEQTANEFHPDGFFKTGDVARLSEDGRITLVGRSKDMIITGGYNVYPREVEEVLCETPGVRDAAVVGVPHPDFGEGVIAVAERQPGSEQPSEAMLLIAATSVLAKYKVPKRLFFVDALPRNAMGKVLKAELRKTYAAVFTA